MNNHDIYKIAIDSISAHVAILDDSGVILETNRAWSEFAQANDFVGQVDCVGTNYLTICDAAGDDLTADIAKGIKQVIEGSIKEYFTHYPCHSPTEERWFALRAVPYRGSGDRKVIISHENITPLIKAQELLKNKEKELQKEKAKLEETNVALKVLLAQREYDRKKMEESVLVNVKELIQPYVEKLLTSRLQSQDQAYLDIVNQRLQDIISPFMNKLSSVHKFLTPQEIHVANFVREGKSSKEIAEILMISESAVHFHRKQLRKKLGLTNTASNSRSRQCSTLMFSFYFFK